MGGEGGASRLSGGCSVDCFYGGVSAWPGARGSSVTESLSGDGGLVCCTPLTLVVILVLLVLSFVEVWV